MKIRNGFVSNSSSSSFVVAFPKKPKSAEDVRNMMFHDQTSNIMHPYGESSYSVNTISETIWRDMQSQKPNNLKSISEAISDGYSSEYPDPIDYMNKKGVYNWTKYQKDYEKVSHKEARNFIKENEGKFIYTFSYSDNDGDYQCFLEHGDIFSNLTHVRISRH